MILSKYSYFKLSINREVVNIGGKKGKDGKLKHELLKINLLESFYMISEFKKNMENIDLLKNLSVIETKELQKRLYKTSYYKE